MALWVSKVPQSSKTLCHLKFSYLSTCTMFFHNVSTAPDYNQRTQQLMQLNHLVKDLKFVIESHQRHRSSLRSANTWRNVRHAAQNSTLQSRGFTIYSWLESPITIEFDVRQVTCFIQNMWASHDVSFPASEKMPIYVFFLKILHYFWKSLWLE